MSVRNGSQKSAAAADDQVVVPIKKLRKPHLKTAVPADKLATKLPILYDELASISFRPPKHITKSSEKLKYSLTLLLDAYRASAQKLWPHLDGLEFYRQVAGLRHNKDVAHGLQELRRSRHEGLLNTRKNDDATTHALSADPAIDTWNTEAAMSNSISGRNTVSTEDGQQEILDGIDGADTEDHLELASRAGTRSGQPFQAPAQEAAHRRAHHARLFDNDNDDDDDDALV
eukprot:ANDGO_04630.mRNA.1 hypothetical protein